MEMTQAQKDVILSTMKEAMGKEGTWLSDFLEESYDRVEKKRAEQAALRAPKTDYAKTLFAQAAAVEKVGGIKKEHMFGLVLSAAAAGRAASRSYEAFQDYRAANGDSRDSALKYIEMTYGADAQPLQDYFSKSVPTNEVLRRSLAAGDLAGGGMFITGDVRSTFTDLLVPAVIFFQLGPQKVPMPSGTMLAPRVGGDVSAFFIGETQEPALTRPSFGGRMMNARKLACAVPISNDLMRRGGPDVAEMVQRLAVRRMGITADLASLRGLGTDFSPRGVYNWAGSTATATASPTFSQVLSDAGGMILKLRKANVPMMKLGWVMGPRTENFLMYQIVTPLGIPYFMTEMQNGTFLGKPYATTTNIPENLGGGANESQMLLADWNSILYGETMTLNIKMSEEASYTENGVSNSAFMKDETLIVLRQEFDISVEHQEAVTMLDHQTWGA
jgi:HK97 family phage major capsid protein